MSRYNRYSPITNDSDFYEFLKKKRGLKKVQQFETPTMFHPDAWMRAAIVTDPLIWQYGDHFYKIAHQYYGDASFWWVIAWYNGYPTEAHIPFGALIDIPVNLDEALRVLGL